MPVYILNDSALFPPPEHAEDTGLLAVGGDLSAKRLLAAYKAGIFPWYSEGDPILWWSPDPRLVLYPSNFHISRSMRRLLNRGLFRATMDLAFEKVIKKCAEVRINNGEGTWITSEMTKAYIELHRMGLAHSVETWLEGKIVGGLYGVSLGQCFFGESMYSESPNASKVALFNLVNFIKKYNFRFIDCQVYSDHLLKMGACEIKRKRFLKELRSALKGKTLKGKWSLLQMS